MADLRGSVMMGGKEVKIVAIKRLDIPYPTKLKFIADNEKILKEWKDFLATNPVFDGRLNNGKQYEVELLDETKLQYIVQKHESVFFVDADTGKVIGACIEDIIGDDDIIMVLNGTVTNYLNNVRKTIRQNDPGFMASVGYTSGARNTRSLQWAKNLRAGVDMNSQAYKISCAYAHIYGELERYLPKEVLEDFQIAQQKLDGLAMDAGTRDASSVLTYSMNIRGEEVVFETHKLAPPAGQCTLNYCRYTHWETNLNRFCFAFNTLRTHREEHGGNFYFAGYGILIPNRQNQMKVWKGSIWHGTTLALVDPLDETPDLRTIGVSFILQKSLKTELEREKKNHTMGPTIPKPAPDTTIELDDAAIEPRHQQTMPKNTTKGRPEGKLYQKQRKFKYHLPEGHQYHGMSKNQLIDECASRVRAGTMKSYATSWNIPKMCQKLLENDGILVWVEDITGSKTLSDEGEQSEEDIGVEDEDEE